MPHRALILAALLLLGPLAALPGHADIINQYGGAYGDWPTTTWEPIPGINDPDDGVAEQLDFVGDASNGGGFFAYNANYLFFRMRVDEGTVVAGTYHDTLMILVDQTGKGTAGLPDYGFAWDSKSNDNTNHGMELMVLDVSGPSWSATRMDDIDGNNAKKIAPPDFSYDGGDGYLRTVDNQSTTNFGTTTYVDWAVSWNFLNINTTLRPGQSWYVQFGSIQNATDHNYISADVAGDSSPSERKWSREFTNPEPASLSLLGLALGAAAVIRRRRRTDKA